MTHVKSRLVSGNKLTAFNGENGKIVDGVGFSVKSLGCTDDSTQCVHIEITLQIRVPVNGVPRHRKSSILHMTCN